MILARRVASALMGVGISVDDSELRDASDWKPAFHTLTLVHDER